MAVSDSTARFSFHTFGTLGVMLGLLAAWAVSGRIAGLGSLGVGGMVTGCWWLVPRQASIQRQLTERRGGLVIGVLTVIGGIGYLVVVEQSLVGPDSDPSLYALGIVVVGLVVASQGEGEHAAHRLDAEETHARASVSIPRRWEILVTIVAALATAAGVQVVVGGTVEPVTVASGAIPYVIFHGASSDDERELVALDSGLLVGQAPHGRVHIPWQFVHPPTQEDDRIRLTHLLPYPRVYRRGLDSEADARQFLDVVRRLRR
jgi:hypothetical protein